MEARVLAAEQVCRIRVWERSTGRLRTVHESGSTLFEAPNWSVGGELIVNGDGVLWRVAAAGGDPAPIGIAGVPDLNNDHVLAPDGRSVFVSANDWHLYEAPLEGGAARRITAEDGAMHFLHGVRPDGRALAYVRLTPQGENWWASATIHELTVDGSVDRAVTTHPGPADGCEYSPDGAWIYFNTEQFSTRAGHAQIARVRPDGSALEQLTADERVNWFPHCSPAGDAFVYLSYPPGTHGHPADLPVEIRMVDGDRWDAPTTIVRLHGGQGTLNVNSWAPDGGAIAYVDYPLSGRSGRLGRSADDRAEQLEVRSREL